MGGSRLALTATTMTAYRYPDPHDPKRPCRRPSPDHPRHPHPRHGCPEDTLGGETIDQLIRRRRTELGLWQADVARTIAQATGRQLSAPRLSEWERGVRPVPFHWLPALAAALDIPLDEIAAAAIRSRIR